jgi:hypothetical protein
MKTTTMTRSEAKASYDCMERAKYAIVSEGCTGPWGSGMTIEAAERATVRNLRKHGGMSLADARAFLIGSEAELIEVAIDAKPAMMTWRNDGGSALVPDNDRGRAWVEKADKIQAHGTEAEWDAHSVELTELGGEWK